VKGKNRPRYLQYAAVTKDAAQRSPSALLRAASMSNGSWTFYEAIKRGIGNGRDMGIS
jgi:hypothetical protein